MGYRSLARSAWMGMCLAISLIATVEATGADSTNASTATSGSATVAAGGATAVVSQEQRQQSAQILTSARASSDKMSDAFLKAARERDKRRRDEEKAAKSPVGVPGDSARQSTGPSSSVQAANPGQATQ